MAKGAQERNQVYSSASPALPARVVEGHVHARWNRAAPEDEAQGEHGQDLPRPRPASRRAPADVPGVQAAS